MKLTPFGKLILVVIGLAIIYFGVKNFAPELYGKLIPEPKAKKSVIPMRADLPEALAARAHRRERTRQALDRERFLQAFDDGGDGGVIAVVGVGRLGRVLRRLDVLRADARDDGVRAEALEHPVTAVRRHRA